MIMRLLVIYVCEVIIKWFINILNLPMPDLQLGTIDSFILWIGFHCFSFFKLFVFILRLLTREWISHFLLIKSNGEYRRNKHFSSKKNDVIFHIFNQNKISRVPLRCKSRIVIRTWSVTWNNSSCPF